MLTFPSLRHAEAALAAGDGGRVRAGGTGDVGERTGGGGRGLQTKRCVGPAQDQIVAEFLDVQLGRQGDIEYVGGSSPIRAIVTLVAVYSGGGALISPEGVLTVVSPPSISANPLSRTVSQGTTVGFAVTARGNALEYQWMQNGIPLAGATQSTLWLTNVQPYAAGSYSARVSNAAGAVTSGAASLTIILKPVITEPPFDQTVPVGATVALNVTAVCTAPLTYQWSRNGLNLSGQTHAQLLLSNVTATANGVYAVRVLNSAGSTNAAAKFAVNALVNVLVARNGAGDFVLTWNNPFYVLQAAPRLKGPWQTVSDTSPLTLPASVVWKLLSNTSAWRGGNAPEKSEAASVRKRSRLVVLTFPERPALAPLSLLRAA